MEKNDFLKVELDTNNIPEKYFNSYKKVFFLIVYTGPIVKCFQSFTGILSIILTTICADDEKYARYFQELIVYGSRSGMTNIFIILNGILFYSGLFFLLFY